MQNEKKKTLVVGGSIKPERYANKAIWELLGHRHEVTSIGLREAEVGGVNILTGKPDLRDIHTITMYIGPQNQPQYYDYLLGLSPKRIIFNPGTENEAFENMARDKGIETIRNCTLIMLHQGEF